MKRHGRAQGEPDVIRVKMLAALLRVTANMGGLTGVVREDIRLVVNRYAELHAPRLSVDAIRRYVDDDSDDRSLIEQAPGVLRRDKEFAKHAFVCMLRICVADRRIDQQELDWVLAVARGADIPDRFVNANCVRFFGPVPSSNHERERHDALNVLGLKAHATKEEIKRKFLELSKEFHPDKHGSLPLAMQELARREFVRIKDAFDVLNRELDLWCRQIGDDGLALATARGRVACMFCVTTLNLPPETGDMRSARCGHCKSLAAFPREIADSMLREFAVREPGYQPPPPPPPVATCTPENPPTFDTRADQPANDTDVSEPTTTSPDMGHSSSFTLATWLLSAALLMLCLLPLLVSQNTIAPAPLPPRSSPKRDDLPTTPFPMPRRPEAAPQLSRSPVRDAVNDAQRLIDKGDLTGGINALTVFMKKHPEYSSQYRKDWKRLLTVNSDARGKRAALTTSAGPAVTTASLQELHQRAIAIHLLMEHATKADEATKYFLEADLAFRNAIARGLDSRSRSKALNAEIVAIAFSHAQLRYDYAKKSEARDAWDNAVKAYDWCVRFCKDNAPDAPELEKASDGLLYTTYESIRASLK